MVDRADDKLKGFFGSIDIARYLKCLSSLPVKLLCECAAYDAAALVSQERFLFDFGQHVFGIHGEKVLGFNGKVCEFTDGFVYIPHAAKIVCRSNPFYSRHGCDAVLVGVWDTIKATDAIARDQACRALVEGSVQRRNECLQRAKKENAYGNTGGCARGPNPVLPEMFQDKGCPFHR